MDKTVIPQVVTYLHDSNLDYEANQVELIQAQLNQIQALCDQTIDELNIQQGDFGIEFSTETPAKSVASVILWLRTVKMI